MQFKFTCNTNIDTKQQLDLNNKLIIINNWDNWVIPNEFMWAACGQNHRQTSTTVNITFPRLSWRGLKSERLNHTTTKSKVIDNL